MSSDELTPPQAPPDAVRFRRVVAAGHLWVVREIPAPAFDRRGGTHLVFECDEIMRRVRVFPANWFDLDDAALYSLSTGWEPGKEPQG